MELDWGGLRFSMVLENDVDVVIPDKNLIPLRTFPITVPILTFQFDSLYQPPPEEEFTPEVPVTEHFGAAFSRSSVMEILERISQRRWAPLDWYLLAHQAEQLSLLTSRHESLLVLTNLQNRWKKAGVVAYPHQIAATEQVIKEMNGCAILADEVGLGKTIEACMIMKEYMLRGMVSRVLILTPAGLCWQWYGELKEKFGVLATIQRSEYDWERSRVIIASMDRAKRNPHREIIHSLTYDMVIIDEAHKLKNHKTMNWQFVNGIKRKYTLMLTATPVQNDLSELYTLITLLKPGQLGTYREFKRHFVLDKRLPRQSERLRCLLSQVMIRNRRATTSVEFTKRHVQSVPIQFSPEEDALYKCVTCYMQDSVRELGYAAQNVLALITLQREVCSTPLAAAVTLERLIGKYSEPKMRARLEQLHAMAISCSTCSKADRLIELVNRIGDKVLVFTEYRASQQYLRWRLEQHGLVTLGFDGSLSSSRKDWVRELFRRQGDVLVSTESGGEGLNFQFACHVINYDLPWNPMRLEQRIGRVHRLGQTRPVYVYNMATANTIEEHILYLLYEKINMFNLVIGDLELILAELGNADKLEARLYEIVAETAHDPERLRHALEHLAQEFAGAQAQVRAQKEKIDSWLTW
jgi:SNF2 family DNA or RNA helicase